MHPTIPNRCGIDGIRGLAGCNYFRAQEPLILSSGPLLLEGLTQFPHAVADELVSWCSADPIRGYTILFFVVVFVFRFWL